MRSEPQKLDAGTRLATLIAAAACLLPLLLQLPVPMALAIAAVGIVVALLTRRRPVPRWLRAVLALALVAIVLSNMRFSLGRDTGCALLAAMLAIKSVELDTLRDARSLLGFALFAPFATFLLDQGPLSLLLGLCGALLALAALLRLSEFESGDTDKVVPVRTRMTSVLRLVGLGVPLALAAFWLFPRIATPLWGVPERALARPGLSDTMSPGQWIDFMTDDRPAMRARFFGTTPDTSQMYWRGPVLTDFDGRDWTQSPWLSRIPVPAIEQSNVVWDYELEVEPTDRRLLPALELTRTPPDGVGLYWDHVMVTPRPLSSVTRWRMQASPPLRFETELPTTLRQAAMRLPEGFNPRTVALGRQWRQENGAGNDAAIAQRAISMIQAEFGYTLDTPLPGRHSADEFLFDWKQGFCEHYSSAFVILMRAAGIPSRVVTGYVGGYRNPIGNYWIVRRMDAHAWAEIWLDGRGWVRVDPTAAVAPERIYDTLEDRSAGALGNLPGFGPAMDVGDWLRRGWNDFVLGFDAARQTALLRPLGVDRVDTPRLILLFSLVAALALGGMLWLAARGERERDPVLRAWHRLGRRYSRVGLGRAPHEPALAWVARISEQSHAAGSSLRAITQRFTEWRYAMREGNTADARNLIRDLHRHRPEPAGPRSRPP